MSSTELNEIAAIAADYVNNTNRHIFLTGKAGTGKTTFLKYIIEHTYKNTVVAAPTGIAAINAGGVTLHSLLHLPFGAFVPEYQFEPDQHAFTKVNTPITLRRQRKFRKEKLALLREMELLIIDEVSMLRADLLDCIDVVLRSVRRDNSRPFGGLQILFIGDLLQLPPVVKQDEWTILQRYYPSAYFFDARALQETPPLCVELQKIYRQSDQVFIDLLNRLRHNQQLPGDLDLLNEFFLPKEEWKELKGYIYLTTHNRKADRINQERLAQLKVKSEIFEAEVEGQFPENLYPNPEKLELKVGAQVMFIKNDPSGEGRYFNGKIGEVSQLKKGEVWVRFEQQKPFQVEPYAWEHKRYNLNERTQEVEEDLIGTFAQYPLKLAWAVTIHKSQGLTFERAILDMENTFAPGQLYVALSRLTSLKGLVLASPLPTRPPDMDAVLQQFVNGFPESDELKALLEKDRIGFLWRLAKQAFDFESLMEKFRDHEATFNKKENRSLKQQFLPWTRKLIQETAIVVEPGKKFIQQVTNILAKGADLDHLAERMDKAQGYFEPILKGQLKKFNEQLTNLKGKKKTKHYREELEELREALVHQLRQIMKLVMLVQESAKGNAPSKAKLKEWEIQMHAQLKVVEPPKLPSHEVSYQLFRNGKNIAEIAVERDLAEGTIEQHLTTFIESGDLAITELLDLDKVNQILAVSGEELHMVGKIKTALGEDFSYPEIRWVLAHKRWELASK